MTLTEVWQSLSVCRLMARNHRMSAGDVSSAVSLVEKGIWNALIRPPGTFSHVRKLTLFCRSPPAPMNGCARRF